MSPIMNMVANRTREIQPSGMKRGAYGNVDYGGGQTGTESGNAETAKPTPKVKRAVLLSRPPFSTFRTLQFRERVSYLMMDVPHYPSRAGCKVSGNQSCWSVTVIRKS